MLKHKIQIGPNQVLTINNYGIAELFDAGRKLHGVALSACIVGSQVSGIYVDTELRTRLLPGAKMSRIEGDSLTTSRPKTLDEFHRLWLTFPQSKKEDHAAMLYAVVAGGAEWHNSTDKPYLENATLEQRLEALDRISNPETA